MVSTPDPSNLHSLNSLVHLSFLAHSLPGSGGRRFESYPRYLFLFLLHVVLTVMSVHRNLLDTQMSRQLIIHGSRGSYSTRHIIDLAR